jgi:hypothetical protein
MGTRQTPASGLGSVGFSVNRCGLATTLLWIGALKFNSVLLGAALLTAAESLRAARAVSQS